MYEAAAALCMMITTCIMIVHMIHLRYHEPAAVWVPNLF